MVARKCLIAVTDGEICRPTALVCPTFRRLRFGVQLSSTTRIDTGSPYSVGCCAASLLAWRPAGTSFSSLWAGITMASMSFPSKEDLPDGTPWHAGVPMSSTLLLTRHSDVVPRPVPRSAPVVGSISVFDAVRDAMAFNVSKSDFGTFTCAVPSPPSLWGVVSPGSASAILHQPSRSKDANL